MDGTRQTAPGSAAASAGSTAATIIALDKIAKRFSVAGRELVVLDGLSLSVASGSFLSIIGPSGCGKSTLLKLIAGLEPPDGGTGCGHRTLERKAGSEILHSLISRRGIINSTSLG